MAQTAAPEIPDYRVNVADYGAVGDGTTLCTDAFAKAIAAVEAHGGGHVDVPVGVYLTGPIELTSHIDLHLDHNATLYFSPDPSLYVQKEGAKSTRGRYRSAISAEHATDISITGGGLIDGSGNYWRPVKRGKQSDEEWHTATRAALTELYALAKSLGGQMSGEHGTGNGRLDYLKDFVGERMISLYKAIKLAFDDKLILNPGKVIEFNN